MSENKPIVENKQSLTAELLPAEGHANLGYKIFEILGEILQAKNDLGLPAKWNRFYELGRNKHWKQDSAKATLVTANLLHTHRQRTVNMLTDNNPTFNVRQTGEMEPGTEETPDKLLRTAEFWWSDQEQQSVLEESVINGETYGVTIEKVPFNPDLESGLGEVETLVVDPFYFGLYPVKTMQVQKAEACLHYWPMSVREARRMWPEHAEDIQSDNEVLKELGDERIANIQGGSQAKKGYFGTIAGLIKNMLNTSNSGSGESDQLLVVECWAKDFTKDDAGNLKYPGAIRCVQTCNAGKIVLSDRPNPSINPELPPEQASKTYLWDKFPFSKTMSVTDTTNPWGMSDFEQLEALNIEVDKTISQMTLIKDKVSRIKVINPKDSGVSNEHFTNVPGIINPSSALVAQGIRYLDMPQMPMDLPNVLNIYKELFFLVAGSFDMDMAKDQASNVIAYKAIAALLERAATMLKGKIRNYSKMIRERGRMYLSHVMNWYTEDRWISYEKNGDETSIPIRGSELIVPARLNVISGSTMPVSRIQEREEALTLFQQGAIDAEALLEKIDWPDRKKLMERLRLGPLGNLIQKLEKMGAPPAMLEAIQEIGQMDPKDFDSGLEKGEIPMFAQLLQPPEQQGPNPMENAELGKADAEIRKVDAEIALIQEKVNTEKVDQSVRIAGVEFDKEKLAIERAKLISDIKAREVMPADGEGKPAAKETKAPAKAPAKVKPAPKPTPAADKPDQGPYIEKGLQSNNMETPNNADL